MTSSFVDALYSKYCDNETLDIIELPQDDGHRRICEYVGFEKVLKELKNLSNLRVIDLSNQQIKTLYDSCQQFDSEQLKLKKAYSLNLAKNQLENWIIISKIIELTPSLEELILSSNPLKPLQPDEIIEIGDKFSKLKAIVLGDIKYSWENFLQCFYLMPSIETVNLFENNLTQIDIPGDKPCFLNLVSLSLSHNPISKWTEICKLGSCSRLEKLELPYCKIESILFLDDNNDLFPNLRYLDLSYNQIIDWRSVAELNKLPKLDTLLLKRNPLFDTKPYYHNFNFILGKIKNLIKLDREPVTKEVRNDAEKYYLRMIYLDYVDIQNDPQKKQQFLAENPCFLELLDKFGEPIVARKLTKEETIKKNFFTLNICDEQNPDKIIQKQIPVTLKVSNLKFILRRLLKIDMDQDFTLFIKSVSNNYVEEMEDRNDVLSYRFDSDTIIYIRRL